MRILLLLVLSLAAAALAAPGECHDRTVLTCQLPNGAWLGDQVFCQAGASALRHEMAGSSCSDLRACCFHYAFGEQVVPAAHASGVRVTGGGRHDFVSDESGKQRYLRIPAGYSVRVEAPFGTELCLDSIFFAGSLRVSRHFAAVSSPAAVDRIASPAPGVFARSTLRSEVARDNCHLTYVVLEADKSEVLVQAIDGCLTGATEDAGGVCNGDAVQPPAGTDHGMMRAVSDFTAHARARSRSAAALAFSELADAQDHGGRASRSLGGSGGDAGGSGSSVWSTVVYATTADKPIFPFAYCNGRYNVTFLNNTNVCYSVWGYENPNNYTVEIDEANNYFVREPLAGSTSDLFAPGTTEQAFLTFWDCSEHVHVHHSWFLRTDLVDGGVYSRRPKVHRLVHNCPDSVLALTFEGELLNVDNSNSTVAI